MRRALETPRRMTMAIAVTAALSCAALAQALPAPAAGDSVRITAPTLGLRHQQGVLISASADSVRMRTGARDSTVVSVPRAAVTRFEVADREPRRATAEGALLGGLTGLTVGAIATVSCPGIWNSCRSDPQVTITAGLAGALLGAGVGSLYHITNWRDVPLTQDAHLSLMASRRSLGARLTIKL